MDRRREPRSRGGAFKERQQSLLGAVATASDDRARPWVSAGDAVHLTIDGAARDFVLAPLPEDVDYFPPADETYRECAARELTRTVATYLAWV